MAYTEKELGAYTQGKLIGKDLMRGEIAEAAEKGVIPGAIIGGTGGFLMQTADMSPAKRLALILAATAGGAATGAIIGVAAKVYS